MSWLRLDDGYMSHEKILQLKDGEFRLWHAALAECNKQANDGIFPKATLRVLYGHLERPKTGLACTLALVKVGLWYDLGSHIQIHDYLEYQISSDQRKRLNKAAAKRMQKHRENKISRLSKEAEGPRYGVTDTVTDGVTNAVTSPVVTPEVRTVFAHPNPTQPNPTRNKEDLIPGQVQSAPLPDLPGPVLQPGFALQIVNSSKPKPVRARAAKEVDRVSQGGKILKAFREAFGARYQDAEGNPVPVPSDAKTNTLFCRLAKAVILGKPQNLSDDQAIEEACAAARHYVSHQDALYVNAQHSPGLMEAHWHKLMTEVRTGRTMTYTTARQQERTAGNGMLQLAQEMRQAEIQRKRNAIDMENK